MIDFPFKITIKFPANNSIISAKCAVIEELSWEQGNNPSAKSNTVLLIDSAIAPLPGCIVETNSFTEYEIAAVKRCCNLKGITVAFRCVAVH